VSIAKGAPASAGAPVRALLGRVDLA
jgi:hypothetical protein